MTTAMIRVAKNMVSEYESLKESEIASNAFATIELLTMITLPVLLPIAIILSV